MSLTTILLDFGGTLDSPGVHWSTQFAESFIASGLSIPREDLDKAFLSSDQNLSKLSYINTLGLKDTIYFQVQLMLDELHVEKECMSKIIADHFYRRALFYISESVRLLIGSKQKYCLGLVSNFTPNLLLILKETGLLDILHCVICSSHVQLSKPNPKIFELALTRCNALPNQTVMIGDSLKNDIMPAKMLGLQTIWLKGDVVFGSADRSAADYIVSTLEEALNICNTLSFSEEINT